MSRAIDILLQKVSGDFSALNIVLCGDVSGLQSHQIFTKLTLSLSKKKKNNFRTVVNI